MTKNWKREKPSTWTTYEWEHLRCLNNIGYQLKVLNDRLDAIDTSTEQEVLHHILNTQAQILYKENERYQGNMEVYLQQQPTEQYVGNTQPLKYNSNGEPEYW